MASLAEIGRPILTRVTAVVAIGVAAVGLARTPLSGLAAQTPTFSTKTEAVYVTATVIDKDGRLVTGLTKGDFEISDNGTAREITVFRSDTIPFAIVIMLDVSGSMFPNLGLMRRGIDQLITRFEPGDRASIGTFQGLPMITPRFTANRERLMESVSAAMGGMGAPCMRQWDPQTVMRGGFGSAVWGAVECGIEHVASDVETPRRVVMIVTDAEDNASRVGPADLKKLADQYSVMIYGIGMAGFEGLDSERLRDLAETSGGGYFHLKDFDEVVTAFARIAEELRHQYIFGFTPTSPDDGKQSLQVRALRPGTITRSRRVYLQAAPVFTSAASAGSPGTAPAGAPASSAPTAPKTGTPKGRAAILDALDRYEHGEWRDSLAERGENGAARRLGDVARVVVDWVRVRGPEHEPRRRLAGATYLLELLERYARDSQSWQDKQPASGALEWVCSLLRQGPPLPSELWWHAASVGLLERAGAAAPLVRHLEHVEGRFPGQPHWAIARAVAEELTVWPDLRDDREIRVRPEAADRVSAAFTRASIVAPSRAEAHLRWGFVELRQGRIDSALTHFDQVGSPVDTHLRYWLHLFTGRALQRAGRLKEAIASYDLALTTVPYAQSAAFSLGAALVEDRRPSEAAALMIRAVAVQPAVQDPWTAYLAPEMRFWPGGLIARLRRAIVQ